MLPQGISYYFFSYEGEAFVNEKEKLVDIDPFYKEEIKKCLKKSESRFGISIKDFDLDKLNIIEVSAPIANSDRETVKLPSLTPKSKPDIQTNLIISNDYEVLIKNCIPREIKEVFNTLRVRVRTPWTIEVGLFKDYLREDKEDLLLNCFEFDWSSMKQLKYKAASEADIKTLMRSCYSLIKEHYKIQAGYGMQGTIFSVALNQYTDFLKETLNLIDGVALNQSDADRYFITVNANKRGPLIPANALVRF